MFRARCKKRAELLAYDGGGGGGPSNLTPWQPWQPWLYVLGKAEHRSPTSDTYSVLYVLEYRSPTVGGKGVCVCGGGGGTISAEGGQYLLADYVRGGQFSLADYVRGDKICGGTESAPTPALYRLFGL